MNELFGTPLGWIMWVLYQGIKNYGIALLLFTILVKALLFPLSIKQQKSSAKMGIFQPKIAEIQKKYANNKQKQQEEMMKLYEAHGYNPMSGCLPLLIQFPILFGIIDVVYRPLKHILRFDKETITAATKIVTDHAQAAGQTMGQPELQVISLVQNPETVNLFSSMGTEFIDKVSQIDYSLFGLYLGEVPTLAFNWLILVPILSGVTSLLVSMISMKMSPAAQQQTGGMMKGMMYLMPLMSVWIAFTVPVGVGIYWIISNMLSGVQSVLLHYMYNPQRFREEYEQKMLQEQEQKRLEREKRRALKGGGKLPEEEEEERLLLEEKEKQSAVRKKRDADVETDPDRDPQQEYLTAKEINRKRLAEARKRDAEKYGEEYIEVTDKDLM